MSRKPERITLKVNYITKFLLIKQLIHNFILKKRNSDIKFYGTKIVIYRANCIQEKVR